MPANGCTAKLWQKTNLIRYTPSGTYFARVRISGKLIRQSLKTKTLSVARLKLADFTKGERLLAGRRDQVTDCNATFGECLKAYEGFAIA